MTRIVLHIGPDSLLADRMQRVLAAKRGQLQRKGVLYPRSPGSGNHTRLYMAVSNPGRLDALRFHRGFILPQRQAQLARQVQDQLRAEIAQAGCSTVLLSAHQLGSALLQRSEMTRLRELLAPLAQDIRIIAHVDAPARMLARRYAVQVIEGRGHDLLRDLALTEAGSWWDAALAARPQADPRLGQFPEVEGPCAHLDLVRLQTEWETVFGAGRVALHSVDPDVFWGPRATDAIRAAIGLEDRIGKADPAPCPALPAAAWLTRCRRFNTALRRLLTLRPDMLVTRQTWRRLLAEFQVDGPAPDPAHLGPVTRRFADDIAALCARHDGLDPAHLACHVSDLDWQEADPLMGFRETHYLAAFLPRIKRAETDDLAQKLAEHAQAQGTASDPLPRQSALPADADALLTPMARDLLPTQAKQTFLKLQNGPFAPHNRLGAVNEEDLAAAYDPAPPRDLAPGRTGRVIVGCMKNEAPYIVEWIAYHRAIGFDNFLIYTNDCSDGTTEILDRLQELGIVQHRDNSHWTGNSPQQFALDAALDEPVVQQADWIAHIDVDEFVNVRCGNGTLDDFLARVPDATNIAMTWRLFGHNGVTRLEDRFVIDQFDMAAPRYIPKPHTAWGFKTMTRNIGAYGKLSCHRPNRLSKGFEDRVRWVNGSGQDMTHEVRRNGWRNSKRSIGYDLLQLNHYALRSAESFLIKRQRGRALHVDRSIGLNYWVRMDWSVHRDITIKRNIPRLRAEYDRLMMDAQLAHWHRAGLDWHRAKAQELHGIPEFADLFQQAVSLRLTATERVAYALALDMES